jgi:hypothetical protein
LELPESTSGVRIAFRTVPEASALQWLHPAQAAGGRHPFLFGQCPLLALAPSTLVMPKMVLTLRRVREPEPETPKVLPVLYRDEDLLVVAKPAGLPMHPSARCFSGTLVALARPGEAGREARPSAPAAPRDEREASPGTGAKRNERSPRPRRAT